MFTMRFLGGEAKAPLLKDVELDRPEEVAKHAIDLVERLLEAFIVHGDLSQYNLLYWNNRLFVIDFPQAVDFSSNVDRHIRLEEAKPLLLRDLENLESYFAKYGVQLSAEDEYHRLLTTIEC
jgi:RIO kinase 1